MWKLRLKVCIPPSIYLVCGGDSPSSLRGLYPWGTSRLGDSHLRNPDFTQELFPWVDSVLPAVWVRNTKGKASTVFALEEITPGRGVGFQRGGGGLPHGPGLWVLTA